MLTTLLSGAARNLAATARAAATDVVAGAAHVAERVSERGKAADAVLRVAVLILSEATGPVCSPQSVRPALTEADRIFSAVGIRVRPLWVRVLTEVAPERALDPHANQRLLLDDMLGHTSVYRRHLPAERGMGAPVTVVVVRDIAGRTTGCSLGLTTDWVICQRSLFDQATPNRFDTTVLAHELGHALNLPHHRDRGNLMFPSSSPPHQLRGTDLRPWQGVILHGNRHTLPVAGAGGAALPAGDGCGPDEP